MIILSKFKDYYDFAAGYDTDPRKVYERKTEFCASWEIEIICKKQEDLHLFFGVVWFCDQIYPYIQNLIDKKFYFKYEEIPENIKEKILRYNNNKKYYYSRINLESHFGIKPKSKWYNRSITEKPIKLNTKYNCPIIFSYMRDGIFEQIVKNGKLTDVGFNKVKTPQEAYTEIYNFIPYIEPEMPSDPTDMIRFENKGFDKKTSFRG